MLSSGTRIGPNRIVDWLGEGSCGQSYQCAGSVKGQEFYVKLISRDVSERKGFQDYFVQETQALEQLDGPGLWPIENSGVTKWKHWIGYNWLEGEDCEVEVELDDSIVTEVKKIRTLQDLVDCKPDDITPDQMLNMMICFHRGLNKAHLSGVCHGNIKPSNILVQKNKNGDWECFITELGVYRLCLFTPYGLSEEEKREVFVMNVDGQTSFAESEEFRPPGVDHQQLPEEDWDLYAVGKVVDWAIGKVQNSSVHGDSWEEWKNWVSKAIERHEGREFITCAHSMNALPGVGDISRFGVKIEEETEKDSVDLEELRLRREMKFKLNEKIVSLKTKRGITGIVGGVIFAFYLLYSIYLFFLPTPWTEYSLKGLLDSYQLGAGLFGGQAWGIVPANYDEEGDGGQDVVGEWERVDGLFVMKFKRFKKSREEESGKKLWQFIGEGKTSEEDYFIWKDFLKYDSQRDVLLLVKREDSKFTYVPGVKSSGSPRLYPEERIKSSMGEVRKSELVFESTEMESTRWSLFFAIGFIFASLLYHRELKNLTLSNGDIVE